MKRKFYFKVLFAALAVALIFNIYLSNNYPIRDITKMYIRIAQGMGKIKLYDASNFYYKVAKKIAPTSKAWYDYNIAVNIRQKYWDKPMTPHKQNELKKALEYLDSESKNFPNNLDILAEYAYIYYLLEDYDKSIEYFEKVITRNPEWEYGLLKLSYIYALVKHNYTKSNEYTNKALAISKNYKDDLYFRKGYNHMNLEEYDKAIEMFELYLKNNPNSVAALVNITHCEIKNKLYDKAKEHVKNGLKLNKYSSYLLESKISILIHEEKYEEAKSIIKEMTTRNKYDGYIGYFLRGILEKKQGNFEQADKYFKMAKENAQEFYRLYCKNNYDLNDFDGNCANRYKFLDKYDENMKKPIEL